MSYVTTITVVDCFIDVMNRIRDKGCELVDCADYRHVLELLDVVKICTEWENENAGSKTLDKFNFLPMLMFEDTVWTCFGIVGLARK